MSNRLRFINAETLRRLGITPATAPETHGGPDAARLMAGIKLSFAGMLKKDLNRSRRKDFIGNFNCSRADGSKIVYGCSAKVWRENRSRALSEALAYLEMIEAK